jgi:hypothetical protein
MEGPFDVDGNQDDSILPPLPYILIAPALAPADTLEDGSHVDASESCTVTFTRATTLSVGGTLLSLGLYLVMRSGAVHA